MCTDTKQGVDYSDGKICPYCGQPSQYTDSAIIFGGVSFGMIYLCKPCDAYVGVHKGTDKALGRLGNKELREAKKAAHWFFDQIARTSLINQIWPDYLPGVSNRNKAYRWLALKMGISVERCHIGMFDYEQCRQVMKICLPYIPEER